MNRLLNGLFLLMLGGIALRCGTTSHAKPGPPVATPPATQSASASDWCAGHSVPESKCTLCNPELIPQFQAAGDWCAGHGLPESVCPACNPALSQTAAPVAMEGDWCAGHSVPESKCTLCNPELIPQFQAAGDWCAGHGLPESVCPACNPAPSQTAAPVAMEGDWCAGHSVPESKCTLCNPELIPQFQAAGDWCGEHGLPESVCPSCNPESLEKVPLEQRVVRFLSPEKETQVGVRTVPVQQGPSHRSITAPARIEYHADGVADLRTVVAGVVQTLHVPIGAKVEAGQALFDLVSPAIGQAQADLRMARARVRVAQVNLKRQESLQEKRIAAVWDVEQAEMELASALAQVAALESVLQTAGAEEQGPAGLFTLRAPISGRLVHRTAILGTLADEATSLGLLADTEHLWVICDLPERQVKDVQEGSILEFRSEDGTEASGELTWISTEVDPQTRTVSVRAQVCNHDGRLRAHQFGRATLQAASGELSWWVPAASVQRIQQRSVVFVRRTAGTYQPREVTILGSGDPVAVKGRLSLGEEVVTTGAVLLRTEMLPGSIGAGCCEVEPLNASEKER